MMIRRHRGLLPPIVLAGLGACSGGGGGGAGSGADRDGPDRPVTADYLAGQWCYTHQETRAGREDMGIAYLFRPDGSLLHQDRPGSAVDHAGRFIIDGRRIRIRSAFTPPGLTVESASDHRLVLAGARTHHFLRGPCG